MRLHILFLVLLTMGMLVDASPQIKTKPLWSKFTDGNISLVSWSPSNLLAVYTTANKLFVFNPSGELLWEKRVLDAKDIKWNLQDYLAVISSKKVLIFKDDGTLVKKIEWPKVKDIGKRSDNVSYIDEGVPRKIAWLSQNKLVVVVETLWGYRTSPTVVSGLWNTTLELIDTITGEKIWVKVLNTTFKGNYIVYDIKCFSNLIAIGDNEGIKVFDEDGNMLWEKKIATYKGSVYWDKSGCLIFATYGKIYVFDKDGNILTTINKTYDDFTANSNGLMALGESTNVEVYDVGGRLIRSLKLKGFVKKLDLDSNGRLAVKWCGEEEYKVSWIMGSLTYLPFGIKIYDGKGKEVMEIVDWYFKWSPQGLLAVWHPTGLKIYSKDLKLIWEKSFLDYVNRLSWNSKGILCLSMTWIRGPSPENNVLFYDISGRKIDGPSFNLRRTTEAFFSKGFLVVIGYSERKANVLVYDEDFKLKYSWTYEFGKEIHIPIADINEEGLLAIGFRDMGDHSVIQVCDVNSGVKVVNITVGKGLDFSMIKWYRDGWIAYIAKPIYGAESKAGIVNINGSRLLEISTYNLKNIEWIGDKIMLQDYTLKLYDLNGKMSWQYEYSLSCTSSNGVDSIAAAASYNIYVFNLEGEILYRRRLSGDALIKFLKYIDDKIVVGLENGTTYILDENGNILQVFDLGSIITSMDWFNEDYIAFGTRGGVYLFKYSKPVKLVIELPESFFYVTIGEEKYTGKIIEITLPTGSYNIKVPELVEQEGIRYRFKEWSDGVRKTSRIVDLISDLNLRAIYEKEYLIIVKTNYGKALGGGWYREGSKATIRIEKDIIDFGNSTRVVFTGWSTGSKEKSIILTVDKPLTITAYWKKQYLITVKSLYGEFEGIGWHDKGSTVILKVKETEITVDGRKFRFSGWLIEGKEVSKNPTLSIKVDKPLLVEAKWEEIGEGFNTLYLVVAIVAVAVIALKILKKK